MTRKRSTCPICNSYTISKCETMNKEVKLILCINCGFKANANNFLCASCHSTPAQRVNPPRDNLPALTYKYSHISSCHSCNERDVCSCCGNECHNCHENICASENCMLECSCHRFVCSVCVHLCIGVDANKYICGAIICDSCRNIFTTTSMRYNYCNSCYNSVNVFK